MSETPKPELKECPFCGGRKVTTLSGARGKQYCYCYTCRLVGPADDRDGHKWNSIPRRSEVAELLRLVDECSCSETARMTSENVNKLAEYANKLRKEWKL